MAKLEEISASLEDYLEAIYNVVAEKQAARAKDIAKKLSVNNSSVTGALRALSEKGLINYAPYDLITLTPPGNELAEDIVRRHEALKEFFIKVLCVDEEEAEDAACKMEHAVSRPILDRLISFVGFVEACPRSGPVWIDGFVRHFENRESLEDCENCIAECVSDFNKKSMTLNEETANEVPLKTLEAGQKGKIKKVKGRGDINKRMSEMGITPGSIIEVENINPSGDPINVKIKGYHISLRKEEFSKIVVDIL